MHRISRRRAWLATFGISIAAALVLSGASVSAPEKAPPPNPIKALAKSLSKLSPAAREAKLYQGAKAEGALNWYTTLSRTIGPAVVKAFEAKYPGIKVSMYRASSEEVTARLYQEANAGTRGADVV